MANMDHDVISEILGNLPVKSILRFKSVSAYWTSLISTPSFERKHLNYSRNIKKSHKCLVLTHLDHFEFPRTPRLYYCASLSSSRILKNVQLPRHVGLPVSFRILCSNDGLVLVASKSFGMLLWNPSTNEKFELPRVVVQCWDDCYFGLGFDSTIEKYKVFKIRWENAQVPCEILTVKSGSWRTIPGCHCFCSEAMNSLAFVESAFHWIRFPGQLAISSFDISSEVYREVPLLEDLCSPTLQFDHQGVTTLQGMLCLHFFHQYNQTTSFTLWAMKQYAVKESWIKLFCIGDNRIPLSVIVPKYLFEDGQVMLLFNQFETNTVFRTSNGQSALSHQTWPNWEDDIDDGSLLRNGYIYTESLISPAANQATGPNLNL